MGKIVFTCDNPISFNFIFDDRPQFFLHRFLDVYSIPSLSFSFVFSDNLSHQDILRLATENSGLDTLGLLDPYSFVVLDTLSLGKISGCYTTKMELSTSTATAIVETTTDS